MNLNKLLLSAALIVASFGAVAHGNSGGRETISPAFQYAIPNVPGKTMTALIVDYPSGGTTPVHRHGQAFVVGYVLSGAIRSQLDDGKAMVYKAGDSWQEAPGAHHKMSDNASKTEPAKLLAIFVADADEKKLVELDKK
ncbi:cupin domain-containing protein [Budvicia diplopodorum]|uniref:cupin domain-containing protein n=1 Tax=Budvicia diplopodorum TaxID=1119056 RepID=UPI00135CC9A9|nr:cupin domain-containing protein [Budvicia diplopodorum]